MAESLKKSSEQSIAKASQASINNIENWSKKTPEERAAIKASQQRRKKIYNENKERDLVKPKSESTEDEITVENLSKEEQLILLNEILWGYSSGSTARATRNKVKEGFQSLIFGLDRGEKEAEILTDLISINSDDSNFIIPCLDFLKSNKDLSGGGKYGLKQLPARTAVTKKILELNNRQYDDALASIVLNFEEDPTGVREDKILIINHLYKNNNDLYRSKITSRLIELLSNIEEEDSTKSNEVYRFSHTIALTETDKSLINELSGLINKEREFENSEPDVRNILVIMKGHLNEVQAIANVIEIGISENVYNFDIDNTIKALNKFFAEKGSYESEYKKKWQLTAISKLDDLTDKTGSYTPNNYMLLGENPLTADSVIKLSSKLQAKRGEGRHDSSEHYKSETILHKTLLEKIQEDPSKAIEHLFGYQYLTKFIYETKHRFNDGGEEAAVLLSYHLSNSNWLDSPQDFVIDEIFNKSIEKINSLRSDEVIPTTHAGLVYLILSSPQYRRLEAPRYIKDYISNPELKGSELDHLGDDLYRFHDFKNSVERFQDKLDKFTDRIDSLKNLDNL